MLKYQESINDKNIFKAFFVIGSGGSGKSFIVDKFYKFVGAKILNSDQFFEAGLKKFVTGESKVSEAFKQFKLLLKNNKNYKISPEIISSDEMQDYRNTIAEMQYSIASKNWMNSMLPMVLDTTGAKKESLMNKKRFLESLGYDTGCLYIYVDENISLKRNRERPRVIPDEYILDQRADIDRNIDYYLDAFGENFYFYDNSYDLRDPKNADKKEDLDDVIFQIVDFFESPIQNPMGNYVVNYLKKNRGKYYTDFLEDFFNSPINTFKYN